MNNCTASCTFTITVYDLPVVSCPSNTTVCPDATPFALTGGTPSGGTYSGPGVSMGVFDPGAANPGVNTITYAYTDPVTECSNTCTFDITVSATMTASVSITADPGSTICEGTSVTFTATPTNGGATPAYQWKLNGANVGSNLATYMNASLTSGDQVACEMTSSATCVNPSQATSNTITMTVNSLATANAGQDQTTCINGVVYLTGTVGGSATGGSWSADVAGGTFYPSANALQTFYIPPANQATPVTLTLTTNGPCPVSDDLIITYGNLPSVNLSASGPQSAACGDEVTITIATVSGFNDIKSYQYVVEWDPAKFQYMSYNAPNIGGEPATVVTTYTSSGQLNYGWVDQSGTITGKNLPNGSTVLTLTLKVLVSTGMDESVDIVGTIITPLEAFNSQQCILALEPQNDVAIDLNPITVDCPANTAVCIDATPFTLTGESPAGGTYSGAGVNSGEFDPAAAGVGPHTISYDYSNGTCTASCTFTITVNALPVVSCPGNTAVCIDVAPYVLTGGSPAGGTYSGAGVSMGEFDPAAAGAGPHTITYTYTDGNGCTASCTFTITVNALPVVSCPGNIVVCIDDAPFVLTGGSPAGGTYSGTGVSMGEFDPATAGLGIHTITYMYTDGNGCTASCTFTVTVTPCAIDFTGRIIWEGDRLTTMTGVKDVTTTLSGDDSDTDLTPVTGNFALLANMGHNFEITPVKNMPMPFALNGLTTADASRITQHALNIFPILDPYKLIAADVNSTNSITTADANYIIQAILGNPVNQFTFINKTWRFVPESYVFPNPASPWGYPQKIVYNNISGNQTNQNFIGIKMGDVNNTANPANFGPQSAPHLVWRVQDATLEQGASLVAEFRADQMIDLLAYQFALRFDPAQLQLDTIETIAGSPMQADNFGLFNLGDGEIRAAVALGEPITLNDGTPVFRLKFKALQSGFRLSEVLQLGEDILLAEAYNSDYTPGPVKMIYTDVLTGANYPVESKLRLFQNRPNPFAERTVIGFELPGACEATLRVFDARGRLLSEQSAYYAEGSHYLEFDFGAEGVSGVLYYELTTPYGLLTKRMVLSR